MKKILFIASEGVPFIKTGGLGDVAIRKGYQAYKIEYLVATSLVLIVFVQVIQSVGNRIYNKMSGRTLMRRHSAKKETM